MTLRTFGFYGSYDPTGGAYGIGLVIGAPLREASVVGHFNVVDALHPPPGHNGTDIDDGLAYSEIICPLDGVVSANFANIWTGPGRKTLYSFTDSSGTHEKVVEPGDYDRAGIVLVLIHEGPWRLPDGRVALRAATTYCHLKEQPPLPVGTLVKAGDVIGIKGTTGISTAPHLHWNLAFQFDPSGFFPPDMSDIRNLTEPTQFIGLPVTEVTETLPGGEFLPESDAFTPEDALTLFRFSYGGNGIAPGVTIRPVQPERPNRRAFYVEV